MNYRDNRVKHLETFASRAGLVSYLGGDHKNDGIPRKNILLVDKSLNPKKKGGLGYVINRNDQYEKVIHYNLLPGVNPDMYKKEKIHDMAHYLNSSQVLCYNFFRPLIDEKAHPLEGLISILAKRGITITDNAVCEFEFNPPFYGLDGRQESSEIDFHIKDSSNGTEVFFEIKYTEAGFGNWAYPKEINFDNFYKPMIAQCIGLHTERVSFNDAFKEDYQLYRNALRVNNSGTYTIFLFPKNSTKLVAQYNGFANMIRMKNNIQAWYWEDIVSKDSFPQVYDKYFAI